MTMRVGAFDRKLSGEHFHNLSCGHTTSRKVSTGLWSPDSDFLTPQKTWKSEWFINILHSLVRIPYKSQMAPTELHRPVETFLEVVWQYDNSWKCFPNNFLSNALSLVVIRQLLKKQTYLVQKGSFHIPKKNASF